MPRITATTNVAKANTRDLTKVLVNINKKMTDFETAVEEFKNYKEDILEVNEELQKAESEAESRHRVFEKDLAEHKSRVIKEVAESNGQVVLDSYEYNELCSTITRLKDERSSAVKAAEEKAKKDFEVELEKEIKMRDLRHESNVASMEAKMNTHKFEIETLQKTIEGLRQELDSQKKLTSQIALSSRPENKNRE